MCFPVNFLHIFRTTFLKNTSGRLLLFDPLFSGNQKKEHRDQRILQVQKQPPVRRSIKKAALKNFTKFTGKHL